jgi:AcrR family transcriptional regulator
MQQIRVKRVVGDRAGASSVVAKRIDSVSVEGTERIAPQYASDWRDYTHDDLPALQRAALDEFVLHGYHGTTVRMLSRATGLSIPGIYHHFASKELLLIDLMTRAMAELYERSLAADAAAGDSVDARFANHIECLVLFHAYRTSLAFIAASEIRSLDEDARDAYVRLRDRQQHILEVIVELGTAQGTFRSEHPRDATRAIVTMCTGVSQWYRMDGELSPTELVERYVIMCRRLLGQTV